MVGSKITGQIVGTKKGRAIRPNPLALWRAREDLELVSREIRGSSEELSE